jgi:folate-binding protein YgfZ
MTAVRLPHRGVLEVSGPEARSFLDRVITCDVDRVGTGQAGYGALLSPQGKILADFFVHQAAEDRFLLDVASDVLVPLSKRLQLYRLRAKVTMEDRSADCAVAVGWGDIPFPTGALAASPDPRLPDLGWRAVVPASEAPPPDEDGRYDAHRISLGIPDGGRDFAYGDAFPHEALMDQLGGVAFDKGCYVGQEVVSRMQHRGTARTRIVPVRFEGDAPVAGTEVTASGRVIGTVGTSTGSNGLATLRLDRATEALDGGHPLEAGGLAFRIEPRDWIRFALPRS